MLLNWLLAEGREEEAERLLKPYEAGGSAAWRYGRAVHLFRTSGESVKGNVALRKALTQNPPCARVPAGADEAAETDARLRGMGR